MAKLFRSKIFAVVMSIITVAMGLSLANLLMQDRSVDKQVEDVNNKIETVKKSNQYLEMFLASLRNPSFLEREAREKLNYKKADEEVAFVYLDTVQKSSQSFDFQVYLSSLPNYKKWFYYLIGK